MKKNLILVVFAILMAGFVSTPSFAQPEEMPTQFLVFEEVVSPSNIEAFMKAQNEAVELWKKYEFDIPFWTYQTSRNSYFWVTPLEDFSSIDVLFKKGGELTKKMREGGYDGNTFDDLSTMTSTVIRWNQKLSYHPSGEYGQSKEKPYVEWMFCYVRSGHGKELQKVAKKYIDFYESIPESVDWDIYQVALGSDLPVWIIMFRSESKAAMTAQDEKLFEKYGEDFKKLWLEFSSHIRRYERVEGWFMPKWSLNLPEE